MATELQFSAARFCTSQSMSYYVLVPRSDCESWTCKRQIYCWSRELKTGVKRKPGFRSKVRSLRLLCLFSGKNNKRQWALQSCRPFRQFTDGCLRITCTRMQPMCVQKLRGVTCCCYSLRDLLPPLFYQRI